MTIAVLVYMAGHPGKVVSAEELIQAVWGSRPMGDSPVYRSISQLRRALGDDSRQPSYIATVPKKGYRLIAAVEPLPADYSAVLARSDAERAPSSHSHVPRRWHLTAGVGALLSLVAVGYWFWAENAIRVEVPPAAATLAVLQFQSTSGSTEDDYLAAGIAEAVLKRLAEFDDIRVIARTSSFSFGESGFEPPRIARLLGVEYLLLGQLRRSNDELRVAAELVDRQGFQVWSGTFDQPAGRRDFTFQDNIASAVVAKLAPQLLPLPVESAHTSFAAYQHFLIGHELLVRRPEGFEESARQHLDLSIAIDPLFSDAYAERALATVSSPVPKTPEQQKTLFENAWRDIETALKLNPDSSQAFAVSGLLMQFREPQDHAAVEANLRRALALDSNSVNAWNWLAVFLEAQGRYDEAAEALQTAARIDPLAPTIGANLARGEIRRGDFEEAEARLRQLLTVPQPARLITITLIELYLELGRIPEALALARERVLRAAGTESYLDSLDSLVWVWAMLGDWDRVSYWQSRIEEPGMDHSLSQFDRAWYGKQFGFPDYAQSVELFRSTERATGINIVDLDAGYQEVYGVLLSLSGNFGAATEILEPLSGVATPEAYHPEFDADTNSQHALAWAWMHTGQNTRARTLLIELRRLYLAQFEGKRMHRSSALLGFARNAMLLDDYSHALDLLEQLERAGWRDYYHVAPDPRWGALRDAPRFQAVMTRVKAALEAQLRLIEESAPDEEFIEQLDAAIRSAGGRGAGSEST